MKITNYDVPKQGGKSKMEKTIKHYKDMIVTREMVTRVGADWENQLKETGKAGHAEVVVSVIRRHKDFDEVLTSTDPLFREAVDNTAADITDTMTAAEAAIVWGLDRSTVKKACQQGRFTTEECRKSGKNWIVTTDGMERVYGRREQL